MKMTQSLITLALFALSAHLAAKTQNTNVIYGEDNRQDVFESTNAGFVELAKSTAAMIAKSNLKILNAGEVEINKLLLLIVQDF
jgi:ABC-type uncharacterized transport system YnjBCD substrate-binding protein